MTLKRFVAAASVALASLFAVSAFAQAPAPPTAPKMDVKPAKTAKKTPPRDPKTGRYMKATPTPKPAKKTPARDPKTGRYMKSDDKMKSDKMTTAKKTPPRDPKTGQFIKTPKP